MKRGTAKLIRKVDGKTPVADSSKLQRLLKLTSGIQHFSLRLYVTGSTARSARAVANIRCLCEEFLSGHYDLEVVDIYQHPAVAMEQQIIAAPTLIKQLPAPLKRMIGDLSDREKMILALGLGKNRKQH